MAKIIKYKFLSGEDLLDVSIECKTQVDFDTNYPIAENEAVGEIIVEGEFDKSIPTEAEALDARLTYIEMMTGLLEV